MATVTLNARETSWKVSDVAGRIEARILIFIGCLELSELRDGEVIRLSTETWSSAVPTGSDLHPSTQHFIFCALDFVYLPPATLPKPFGMSLVSFIHVYLGGSAPLHSFALDRDHV
jgi:hypothetical protein